MKWLIKWLRSLFTKKVLPAADNVRRKRREKEHYGSHYYLGDLLDGLDDAFRDLPRIKRADYDAYAMIRRLGATIMSSDGAFSRGEIEPAIRRRLPSFGSFYFGGVDSSKKVNPRFMYFTKIERAVNVQPTNLPVYRCGATFNWKGRAICTYFHVSVSPDGSVRLLKEMKPRYHTPGFVRMEWVYPDSLIDWANDNETTPEDQARYAFTLMVNASSARDMGLAVRVNKGKHDMVFAIDMLRTPYFFADREKEVNENGSTKRILHIVKGHWRTGSGGERKFVKSHFRGLREFSWNGYGVRIGLAGKHGRSLSDFDLSSVDHLEAQRIATVNSDDAAQIIARASV